MEIFEGPQLPPLLHLLLPPLGQLHSRFPQFQLLSRGMVVEMLDDYGEGSIEDQGRVRSWE